MAVAIGGLMFSTANALFVRQAHADLLRQNQSVAHEIDDLTDRAAAALLIARNSPAFDRYFETDATDEVGRGSALRDIERQVVYLQRTFAIDEICVIDANGVEIARGVLGELAGPQDLSDEEASAPFFAPTLALPNGEVYRSGEPYMSPDTNRWVVAHATPIVLADGRRVGILHFEIPLAWFATKVQDASLVGGSSYLFDRGGHLLVHPDLADVVPDPEVDGAAHHGEPGVGFPHAAAWGSPAFRSMATEMLQNGSGAATRQDPSYQTEVMYQPVFADRWIVATELPHAVIYEPGAQLLRATLVIATPLLAVAVLLMVWYTARLLAPLRRLASALGAIAAGELHAAGVGRR